MDRCSVLQTLLDEYVAEGNDVAAEGIRAAMSASGCSIDLTADSGNQTPHQPQ